MTSSMNPTDPGTEKDMIGNINFQQLPKKKQKSKLKNADINLPH